MRVRIRLLFNLGAAAAIWFSEDAVFSRAFGFNTVQTVIVTLYFVVVFAIALWFAVRTIRAMDARGTSPSDARALSMAPAVVTLVGSFAALPIFVVVLGVGALT